MQYTILATSSVPREDVGGSLSGSDSVSSCLGASPAGIRPDMNATPPQASTEHVFLGARSAEPVLSGSVGQLMASHMANLPAHGLGAGTPSATPPRGSQSAGRRSAAGGCHCAVCTRCLRTSGLARDLSPGALPRPTVGLTQPSLQVPPASSCSTSTGLGSWSSRHFGTCECPRLRSIRCRGKAGSFAHLQCCAIARAGQECHR